MANLSNINNKFLVTTGGNVGIGVTGPTAKLHIGVSSANDDTFHIFNGSVRTHLLGSESSNGVIYLRSSANSNKVRINTSGDSYFNGGNVGIGTTSPTAKLQVSGKSFFTNDIFTLQNKGVFFNGLDDFSSGIAGIDSGTSVRIFAGGSEKVRVKSTGNVGIGTTSPNEKLQVAGNIHAYAPSGIDAGLFASTAAGSTTIAVRSSGITHFNGGKS